jgi:glycosyltransferase involved in cell wall biosynthesis
MGSERHKNKKVDLLIYTGHCEIVGGDAKYLFDLIDFLDSNLFNVTIYTDQNQEFEKKARMHMSSYDDYTINYIETKPRLFKRGVFDSLSRKKIPLISQRLTLHFLGRSLSNYLDFAYNCITLKSFRNFVSNLLLFYRVLKKERSADIFQINNGGYPGKYACLAAAIIARIIGVKKIIMNVHGIPGVKKKRRLSDYFYDILIPHCCTDVIVPSSIIKECLVNLRGFPPNKVHVIYCGLPNVDLIEKKEIVIERAKIGLSCCDRVVIVCGSIEEKLKGHEFLFDAMKKVVRNHKDVKLLVVGDGSDERKKFLQAKAKQLNIDNNVLFLGYRTDIHKLNSLSEFAIVPSNQVEAVPYTIKEASRACKAVVTTNVGGCPEGVDHLKTGIIVDRDDVDALGEAIDFLLDNQSVSKQMGRDGRLLFFKKFLMQDKLEETMGVYLNNLETNQK